MKTRAPLVLGLLLLAGEVTSTTGAYADDKADALAMYKEGADRYRHKDFEGARAALARAWALDPVPKYLWDLAVVESSSDHPVEALEHFRRYLALPTADEDHRRKAAKPMAEAEAKTVRVQIEPPAGAMVSADGREVTLYIDHIVDLPPGKHTIEVHSGTRTATVTIEAKAGELLHPELRFEEPPPPGPVPTQPPAPIPAPLSSTPETPAPTVTTRPPSSARWIVSGGLAVAGVAGLAAGGVFFSNAGSDSNTVAGLSSSTGNCANSPNSPTCSSLRDAVNSHAQAENTGKVAVVAGGALLAAGIVTFLLWPTPKGNATTGQIVPTFSPQAAGAQWVGSF
jgi:hypothetical protein